MKRNLFVLAVMAAFIIGCKEKPLPQHQASGATPPPAEVGTVTPVDTAPATMPPTTTAPAVVPPASGGAVVASTEGEQSGVTANITEFKRGSGGTVMLRFSIVNNSNDNFDFGYSLGDPDTSTIDYNTVGGVHLIDPVNKKKYFVVRDADRKCVCSRDLKTVAPGERINLWAKLPAPPPEVQRVSVMIPKFIPLDDVPLL